MGNEACMPVVEVSTPQARPEQKSVGTKTYGWLVFFFGWIGACLQQDYIPQTVAFFNSDPPRRDQASFVSKFPCSFPRTSSISTDPSDFRMADDR